MPDIGKDDPQFSPEFKQQPPRILSREERTGLFKQWLGNSWYSEYRKNNSDEEGPNTFRDEPENFLSVIQAPSGRVIRRYFGMEADGRFECTDFFDASEGKVYIRSGSPFEEGGEQVFSHESGKGVLVQQRIDKAEIAICYANNGELAYVDFRPDPSFPGRVHEQSVTFENTGDPHVATGALGGFKVADEGGEFIDCTRSEKGHTTLHFRAPKHVDIEEAMTKLVPPELSQDPYNSSAEMDNWRRSGFLDTFGIKKIA